MSIATPEVPRERRSAARAVGERILIVAPTGDDAALAARILKDAGQQVLAVADLTALAAEVEAGAGVVVIASEALSDTEGCARLRVVVERQQPWSELPILLIGRSGGDEVACITDLLGASSYIVFLERPLGVTTFVTATQAALRSRRRQYEVRRLLNDLSDAAVTIERAHSEANRAKDEFLATLAHELRSPMTAIRGWVQMLRMGDLGDEDTATALSMIESSTKVQAHIVEDLMDVSRILSGKVMIEPALIEATPLVRNVVATFRPAAELQGVELIEDVPTDPVTLWADEVRFQQIGWNLVSNAVKFTPPGGSVCVSLRREHGSAVLRVSDTGSGIAPELLPHVFERYRQAEGESSKQHRGLGLGLAIVRHLVESHGGTIEVVSEGVGKGAEFVVKLPLRDAPPPHES